VSELLKNNAWAGFAKFLTVCLLFVAWVTSVSLLAIAAGSYALPATTIVFAIAVIALSLIQFSSTVRAEGIPVRKTSDAPRGNG